MIDKKIEKGFGGITGLIVSLLLVIVCCPVGLHAQQYRATLTGTVTDSTGAKMVKATVTVTNNITKFTTKTVSNGTGAYSIPFLTPGTYTVTVSEQGFRPETQTGIALTAGANVRADFSLKVGNVGQRVVVSANAALLDTASANLGTTLTAKEIADTPNLGRNPFELATLSAGMTSTTYSHAKEAFSDNPWTAVSATANGNSDFRITLDGLPDDPAERLTGATYQGFVPSPEAVQEVKTQTALYDAQYGHGNGTVINTVLRSGSNQFHGSAYYIFRNTYLNANTYERVPNQNGALNPASPTHRVNDQWSQPGFVFDGPVIIPKLYDGHRKTFFMVAYERIQSVNLVAFSGLVPTDAERGGDFSGLCTNFVGGVCAPGAGQQIYDPLTADANNNRTPFPGNIIPAGRMSDVGKALMSFYPEPNTNTSNGVVNYISSQTVDHQKYFGVVARVDHSFSDSNKMNATFFDGGISAVNPNEGFHGGIVPTGIGYSVVRNNEGGSLDDVFVLSPTLVADARAGVIFHPFNLIYPGNKYDLSSIGIDGSGLPYQTFPGTAFSDSYGGMQAGAGGQTSTTTIGSTSLLISKSLGKQNITTGFENDITRYNVQVPQSGFGAFSFNRQFTQQNSVNTAVGNDPNSGNAMAALLLGYPSSGSYVENVAFALQQLYFGLYAQDDWRLTNKLTVNLGLRWDYESPFTERYNRQNSGFCLTCTNPLQESVTGLTLLGGLTFASSSNRHPYPRDLNNFQPRLGAAYQLDGNTVLRGGFGVIYLNTMDSPLGQGFSATTSYVASLDNTHPANSFANPFPTGVNAPTGSSLGLATQLGQSVSFPDPNHSIPKMVQYSVSIQRRLPAGLVLQIAYVGNHASQLETNKSINGIPAQYYNQGQAGVNYLQQLVPNPMAGLLPGSSLNAARIQRQFLLVPFPEFTNVTDDYASRGSDLYNSLQTSVTKRMTDHLSLQGNFTWSKTMDKNIYLNPGQDTLENTFRYQDPNPTLVANIVGIYQFSSLSSKPAWERLTLGGWQVNSVLRAQNGSLVASPASVTLLSNPNLAHRTYGKFFNTCYLNAAGAAVVGPTACSSAASTPAFQQHLSYTLNNIGPYINVRQINHPIMDVSLFKHFTFRKRYSLEIRGEFFNVMNTPIFGSPGTSPGTSAFGVVTQTQANDPRITQLTTRINF